MRAFKTGSEIWIPCEIRKGPFPTERRVYVHLGDSEWFGFVNVEDLREHDNLVRGVIVDSSRDTVTVRVLGHSPVNGLVGGSSKLLREHGAVAP